LDLANIAFISLNATPTPANPLNGYLLDICGLTTAKA